MKLLAPYLSTQKILIQLWYWDPYKLFFLNNDSSNVHGSKVVLWCIIKSIGYYCFSGCSISWKVKLVIDFELGIFPNAVLCRYHVKGPSYIMMLLIVTMGTFPFVVCLFTSGGRAWNNRATLFLKEHSFSFLASDSSQCSKLTNMTSVYGFNQFVKKNKTEKYLQMAIRHFIKQCPLLLYFFFFCWRSDISSDW